MESITVNFNPEKYMIHWWSKIRWFMVLVLFAIGILQVGRSEQTYPIVMFAITFVGISILNILFHLQILKTNNFFSSFQIVLDIIFGTLVVHLTGGMESAFVWIYLIAVITASISIENAGGFIASMIGSMCLLLLLVTYNFGWLQTTGGDGTPPDISSQTVFLISYTGLFSGVAFIFSSISGIIKKLSITNYEESVSLKASEIKLIEKQLTITDKDKLLKKYQAGLESAADISGIDHDINNHLTIISLSVRRILKAAVEYKDMKLSKSAEQMTEAINQINKILREFQNFKRDPLIQKIRKKKQGK
jgi:hypothetical protein